MPLPPLPRRAWRSVVEHSLAMVNGAFLLAFLALGCIARDGQPFLGFVCAAFALALYGVYGRGPRRERALAVVPSGLIYLFVGTVLTTSGLERDAYPARLLGIGIALLALGGVTVEFMVARLRRGGSVAQATSARRS